MVLTDHDGLALAEARQFRFDTILPDLGMPEYNADEVLKRIRSETLPNQATPVFILNADMTGATWWTSGWR